MGTGHIILLCIFQNTVAAILTAVDYSEGIAIVRIPESKEGVIQQIHLQNSFFPGHRLKGELLDT